VEALYLITRLASVSHKILMLMLEPITYLSPLPGKEAALQDVRNQLLKIQSLYNQVLKDINNLFNQSMPFAAQRTNEIMRSLALFSVFFLPVPFIMGIYGMNFEFMPELKQQWGYPAVLLLMATEAGLIFPGSNVKNGFEVIRFCFTKITRCRMHQKGWHFFPDKTNRCWLKTI
jgi:magnesium transporter